MPRCPACATELPADARFCPRDGVPLDAPARPRRDPHIGKLVGGRYRVCALVGAGGMSRVYLARHEFLGRDVALKVLRPELQHDARALGRFAREAQSASLLDHENAVYVLDFGASEEGWHYLVTEHVVGRTLDCELEQAGPLSPARALHVLTQLTAAVGRAHELGIIHRDLKPGNVFLCQRGADRDFVKVFDFGLARPMEPRAGSPVLTQIGELNGTPEYMAPEQWLMGPHDARTDLYALGVTAYELLAGTVPYVGDPNQLAGKHLGATPVSLRERRPDAGIPPMLDEIVLTLLAKDPAARFQTAADLLIMLSRCWTPIATDARSSSYSTTVLIPERRNDLVPDPVVYQSTALDEVRDGAAISDAAARLHELRLWRLAMAIPRAYPRELPADVARLRDALGEVGARVAAVARVVARLEQARAEPDRVVRTSEAEARREILEASVALSGIAPLDAGAPALQRDALVARRVRAERSLTHLERRRVGEERLYSARLLDQIARLRAEGVLLERISQDLVSQLYAPAGADPTLRGMLDEIDGLTRACRSYDALLDALEMS